MKKLMLGALAALCAMLALPALASATPAHVTPTPVGAAHIHGTHSKLTTASGFTTGTTVTGNATFENSTTGRLNLTFTGVKSSIGTNCQSGATAGEVVTTELTFHLVMLATEVPGILITGGPTGGEPWGNHFATFNCGIFIPKVVVRGTGILGTITKPKCGENSNTATIVFEEESPGVQKHLTWTGKTYDLEADIGGGGHFTTAAMNADATITFANGATPKLECTH